VEAGVLAIARKIEGDEGLAGIQHLTRFASLAYQVAVFVVRFHSNTTSARKTWFL